MLVKGCLLVSIPLMGVALCVVTLISSLAEPDNRTGTDKITSGPK